MSLAVRAMAWKKTASLWKRPARTDSSQHGVIGPDGEVVSALLPESPSVMQQVLLCLLRVVLRLVLSAGLNFQILFDVVSETRVKAQMFTPGSLTKKML
jgi:hypothetical protein